MDFQLNEEQLQLKKSVREFAEREIAPHVMQWDEAGEFPMAVVKELGKLGLMGVISPYATGPAPMYFGSGYIGKRDFWKFGLIFGLIYFLGLLLIVLPWLRVIG